MVNEGPARGAFVFWPWGDEEIDNPKRLRRQLLDIHSHGFVGALATLKSSRYEFVDRKVLRAVAQASQWAKKRGLAFWFQTDPRQASRSFINRTQERMQNLLVSRKPEDRLSRKKRNITRVIDNRFTLRYDIPQIRHSHVLQEVSLLFEPVGLESAFLFQRDNGFILKESIQNITQNSRFYANIAKGYVEVFGDVWIPEDEEWWVIAFPKFNTNVYDFAGRESNDALAGFVEELFDACVQLDGFIWGGWEAGYVVDMGRFPVSLSLYNTFIAEYRYDLREVLYGLVLCVDDLSHIKIRCDYYTMLMDIVFGAQKEFHQIVHGFFTGVDLGTPHPCYTESRPSDGLVQGRFDPWRSLDSVGSVFADMGPIKNLSKRIPSMLTALVMTKSLGVFSKSKQAFFSFQRDHHTRQALDHLTDLLGLYSVQWLADDENLPGEDPENAMAALTQKINVLNDITGFHFPSANIVIVVPVETMMNVGSQDADDIILSINNLIYRLVLAGYQCDVISSYLFNRGRVSAAGLQIRNRQYESVIYPYPEILDPDGLEIVALMDKLGLPIFLGGSKPRFTSTGKRIPHNFTLHFDPKDNRIEKLRTGGLEVLFDFPSNALATMIKKGRETLFLLCPKRPKSGFEGRVQYGDFSFDVPYSEGLVIYGKTRKNNIEKRL